MRHYNVLFKKPYSKNPCQKNQIITLFDTASSNFVIKDKPCVTYYCDNNVFSLSALRQLMALVVIVVLSISASLTHAASTDAASDQSQSASQVVDKPNDFVDYAAQQIDTLQKEGIDLPDSVSELMASTDEGAPQQAGQLQGDMALTGEYNINYYILDELNSGLPALSTPANLATPLSTLEFFNLR